MNYVPGVLPRVTIQDENHYKVQQVLLEVTPFPQAVIVHVIGYALEPEDYHVLLRAYHHQLVNRVCPRLIFKSLIAIELLSSTLRKQCMELPIMIWKIGKRRTVYYNKHCKHMNIFKASSEKFWIRTMNLIMKDWSLVVEKAQELNYMLSDQDMHEYLLKQEISQWEPCNSCIHYEDSFECSNRNYLQVWHGLCALCYHALPKNQVLIKTIQQDKESTPTERKMMADHSQSLDIIFRQRIWHFVQDYKTYMEIRNEADISSQHVFRLGLGLLKDAWWVVRNMSDQLLTVMIDIEKRKSAQSIGIPKPKPIKWVRKIKK
jgi:hypothetical protein